MKRILLVVVLVLVSGLLFADVGGEPGGEPAGNLNTHRLAQLVQSRLAVQNQLLAQLGPQEGEPAGTAKREGPALTQARSGDCVGDCDGEPDQTRTRDRLKDGTGDGVPDRDRTRTGRSD